ncbi:MAG TPA: hypothetical protein VMU43_07885 [Candidatus Acidoferrum sp.]|nr:hypothetical protein [Candidatus Acidoferrum sp.]
MTNPIVREPRWHAWVAMIAAGLLYLALPERLSLGPSWLLLAIVAVLMVPVIFSYRRKHYDVTHALTFTANGVITLSLVASLGILIYGLPQHLESPEEMLRSAVALWVSNILVFALWYWKLDAGGPLGRDTSRGHIDSSFLFPQMLDPECDSEWSPQFVDYLFLAFNTSTAFSPTDTAALSRWAKLGMMIQSMISLTIVVLLAARAVNIL